MKPRQGHFNVQQQKRTKTNYCKVAKTLNTFEWFNEKEIQQTVHIIMCPNTRCYHFGNVENYHIQKYILL